MALKKHLLPVLASVSLFAAACGGSANTTATDTAGPAGVLAFAVQSIEDTSYSFEQGQRLESEFGGEPRILGGDIPVVTGQVDGDESFITMHTGRVQASLFESLADDGSIPAEVLHDSGDENLKIWIDGEVIVIDDRDLGRDFIRAGSSDSEDGPVLIDVAQLNELTGTEVDATDFFPNVNGVQATDAADFLAVLSSIDELVEAGTDSVNGIDVDVYTASVSRAEYDEALGQTEAETEAQAEALAELDPELLAALEELNANAPDVFITLMVDREGRTRKVITRVPLLPFSGGSESVIETWQTYDDYGEDFDITPPDAVDVTAEIAAESNS